MVPERPVLLYDGECGFCTRSVRMLERLPADVRLLPSQATELAKLGIPESRARGEVLFVDAEDRTHGGAAAVAAFLKECGGVWRIGGSVLSAPVVRDIAAFAYHRISAIRDRLPGATPACELPQDQWPGADRLGPSPG